MNTLPKFYDPSRVGTFFVPRTAEVMQAGHDLGVGHIRQPGPRVMLLLVDPQVDFIHTNGALSVPGAVDDTRRTVDWIFRHLLNIVQIAASEDSHIPFQISFPSWWRDKNGRKPNPFTQITLADFHNKVWRPIVKVEKNINGQMVDWNEYYLTQLETAAKKTLMIWPYHCLMGTPGHSIEPSLMEAILFHSAARYSQPKIVIKGNIPETEHYSILEPEVKVPDHPMGGPNTDFLNDLELPSDKGGFDLIYIAGQAKSHCVLETVNSLAKYFQAQALDKLRILTDCMSPVSGFEAQGDAAFAQLQADYGLVLRTSSDPLG